MTPLMVQTVAAAKGALSLQEAQFLMNLGMFVAIALGGMIDAVTEHVTRPPTPVQNE